MDLVQVAFTLQRVLKEVPNEIILMILDVYNSSDDIEYCSLCGCFRDELLEHRDPRIVKSYKLYLQNAKKFFKERNWPICFNCWVNDCLSCLKCWIPFREIPILRKTTLVIRCFVDEESDICQGCFESNKYHIVSER